MIKSTSSRFLARAVAAAAVTFSVASPAQACLQPESKGQQISGLLLWPRFLLVTGHQRTAIAAANLKDLSRERC
jgi:hypothetical protein